MATDQTEASVIRKLLVSLVRFPRHLDFFSRPKMSLFDTGPEGPE